MGNCKFDSYFVLIVFHFFVFRGGLFFPLICIRCKLWTIHKLNQKLWFELYELYTSSMGITKSIFNGLRSYEFVIDLYFFMLIWYVWSCCTGGICVWVLWTWITLHEYVNILYLVLPALGCERSFELIKEQNKTKETWNLQDMIGIISFDENILLDSFGTV